MQPEDFQRYLRFTVVVPVVLLAILAALLLWQINFMINSIRDVDHADRVIADGHLLMRLSLDMESGLRGYLLTGDERLLQPFSSAQQSMPAIDHELGQLISGDPVQTAILRDVRGDTREWLDYAKAMLQARRGGAPSSTYADTDLNLEGKRLMDQIRDEQGRLIKAAETDRERHTRSASGATRTVLIMIGLLTLGSAAIIVIVTRYRMLAITQTYNRHLLAERDKGEEAKSNREWLLTTLRSIGDSVIATDSEGRIEFLNVAAEQLTGWKQHEVKGKLITDVIRTFNERTGKEIFDPAGFIRSRRNTIPLNNSFLLQRKDGERRIIDETGAPILDINGQLRGVVLVMRDTTERRKADSALRSSERLALVGRLSATIAHEIQNPLDAVTSLLYLIQTSEGISPIALDYTRSASDEIARITNITRQLLSFNREALQPVPVNLSEIMDSVVSLFQAKLTASGIQVAREYETNRTVIGLPGELRQVFSNLFANATEAVGKGGCIRIRISAASDWRDSQRPGVRVVVSDNGSGIPVSARANLFTPFFTTKGEKGTGLGLWVSRGIVEKHEGRMKFRTRTSEPNRGTSFMVFLPAEPSITASTGTAA